jgi:hypothetical protein
MPLPFPHEGFGDVRDWILEKAWDRYTVEHGTDSEVDENDNGMLMMVYLASIYLLLRSDVSGLASAFSNYVANDNAPTIPSGHWVVTLDRHAR